MPLTTIDTTRIDDTRIGAVRPLITPSLLEEKLRAVGADIRRTQDDRAIVP